MEYDVHLWRTVLVGALVNVEASSEEEAMENALDAVGPVSEFGKGWEFADVLDSDDLVIGIGEDE